MILRDNRVSFVVTADVFARGKVFAYIQGCCGQWAFYIFGKRVINRWLWTDTHGHEADGIVRGKLLKFKGLDDGR